MANPGKATIEGSGGNCLEIELLGNADFSVRVTNTAGETTYADFPNPFNGGGDERAYRRLLKVYEELSSR